MEKTLFIHVWADQDTGKLLMNEQTPARTIQESAKQYYQEFIPGITYLHTLHIFYNPSNPVQSFTREMSILDFVTKKSDCIIPDCERLTGHELGVSLGRV